LKNAPIIKKELIDSLKTPLYNAHSGYLPNYKGVSCGIWPLVNNEELVGVTIHEVVPEIDAGKIIYRKTIKLDKIPSNLFYGKYINDQQMNLIGNFICNYKNKENFQLSEKEGDGKYFSSPGITDYVRGLKNLKQLKKKGNE